MSIGIGLFSTSRPYVCEKVPPSNGIGRIACGFVFRTGSGPGKMGSLREDAGHWELRGHSALVNDDFRGRDYTNNPFPFTANPVQQGSTCEAVTLQSARLPIVTGYVQTFTRFDHADIFPAFYLNDKPANTGYIAVEYDHLAAAYPNTVVRVYGTFPGSSGGQVMSALGFGCTCAIEIRPGDKAVRMWTDPGGDARVTGGGIWTGGNNPMRLYTRVANGVNGFKGRGTVGELIVCKARAISLNVPGALSARISVNGVVQIFGGAVGYLDMPGGVASYDPAPGVWYPSLIRYEFFTGAALGGILMADVSVAKAWGGDQMGLV